MRPTQTVVDSASETSLAAAANCLGQGRVVLIPTDTVYGLAALPSCRSATDRIFEIKDRPVERNLPIMVADISELSALGAILNDPARRLFNSDYMPGPLTVVLPRQNDAATPEWLAGRDEFAVRVPDEPFMLALLKAVGPLFVTSANRHGLDTETTVPEILDQLPHPPDLAVDGGSREVVPSTLVNCAVTPPVILRHGVVDEKEVWRILS